MADEEHLRVLGPWEKKPRFSWTQQFEETFFQSLCQSVKMNLRENMSFKPKAWNRALAALREQGAFPTKAHLINKTDNARKKFRLWRGLVENPQFHYDATTRQINGTEEAWAAHLEKEPLARAFRDRPFENTQYLEVLFPDVIGSGGQPKRQLKPRRRGPDAILGATDETAPPGASIMQMSNAPQQVGQQGQGGAGGAVDMSAGGPVATPMRLGSNTGLSAQQSLNSTPVPIPTGATNTPQHHNPQAAQQQQQQQQRQAPNANMRGAAQAGANIQTTPSASMRAPGLMGMGGAGMRMPNNVAGPGNIMTLQDDPSQITNGTVGAAPVNAAATGAAGQKRYTPGDGTSATAAASKRRRTEGSVGTAGGNNTARQRQRNDLATATALDVSTGVGNTAGAGNAAQPRQSADAARQASISTPTMGTVSAGNIGTGVVATGTRGDSIATLLSDVLSKYATAAASASATRWPEQAMDIFFQEFADEDMDLQVRIAEKILTDTSKAVMFCKMPSILRRHWVKRLRDASTRQAN